MEMEHQFVVAYAILGVVFFVGFHANVLVIYVLHCVSSLRKTTDLYVVNLGVANLIYFIGIPFFLNGLVHESLWTLSLRTCTIDSVIYIISPFIIGSFVAILCVDRYFTLCHPTIGQEFRNASTPKMLSFTAWGASAALMIPVTMYTDVVTSRNGNAKCVILWPNGEFIDGGTSVFLFRIIIGFIIPVPTSIVCTIASIVKLRSLRTGRPDVSKYVWKRGKIVIVFLVVHLVCWLPYWVYIVFLYFSQSSIIFANEVQETRWVITECLAYTGSVISPIVFSFISKDFRRDFCKVCCRTAAQQNSHVLRSQQEKKQHELSKEERQVRRSESDRRNEVDNTRRQSIRRPHRRSLERCETPVLCRDSVRVVSATINKNGARY